MNLIQLTPGAGGMYCGNCFRDNALVTEWQRQGHDVLMVPMYLPMTLDEASTAVPSTPTFFGGINVYLSQQFSWYRSAPGWMRRWMDAKPLLQWAAGKAASTRADEVGELNLSMLRGEEGNQRRELAEMVGWLKDRPRPDVVFLSNALLTGLAREIKTQLGTRVVGFFQSEESFLDAMPEPHRAESWKVLSERAKDVDLWIAPTRYFGDQMAKRLKMDPAAVLAVHNGIALDGYAEVRKSRELRGGPGQPPMVLGFFARQCADKGLDTVVDAFVEVRRRNLVPNLTLKVGGGCGPSDESFVARQKRKLAEAGLLDSASFHPNVSRDEKLKFLASCDVVSVPARFSEAFGLYLLEANAAGAALLQPDVSGFREIVEATGGGEISGANDVPHLVNGLARLMQDPGKARSLGDKGAKTVTERFSAAAMARNILTAVQR